MAIAHGREFLICRRLSSLYGYISTAEAFKNQETHEIKVSIAFSTSCCFKDLRKVVRPGVAWTFVGAMTETG